MIDGRDATRMIAMEAQVEELRRQIEEWSAQASRAESIVSAAREWRTAVDLDPSSRGAGIAVCDAVHRLMLATDAPGPETARVIADLRRA